MRKAWEAATKGRYAIQDETMLHEASAKLDDWAEAQARERIEFGGLTKGALDGGSGKRRFS